MLRCCGALYALLRPCISTANEPCRGRERGCFGSAAAAGPAAAAAATLGPGGLGTGPAAHGDRRQQLDRVVVTLRARARGRGLAHRAGPLKGVAAGAATI